MVSITWCPTTQICYKGVFPDNVEHYFLAAIPDTLRSLILFIMTCSAPSMRDLLYDASSQEFDFPSKAFTRNWQNPLMY
ncbi:hypothetical protein AQUCO_01400287v1 [Aquilegia coerulea]|uniref:Uncharacterized protein n=1 Tax=Aquilegia coerulea TaxID=218851 RepID=A0A2G5DW80_AQUCA|nr:hypothetical protein AQUCO_01400287v1 [Aquilegia coerulea]